MTKEGIAFLENRDVPFCIQLATCSTKNRKLKSAIRQTNSAQFVSILVLIDDSVTLFCLCTTPFPGKLLHPSCRKQSRGHHIHGLLAFTWL